MFILQIANYISSNEDLDYPAKLEQSTEMKSETNSVKFLTLPFLFSHD